MKRFSIIALLLFAFSTMLHAQKQPEFYVQSFEEKPFDTAARDERYKVVDGNGELFSIIKLVSTTPNDDLSAYSFDFGFCESRVREVGDEVWLYVQRNAMRVTICREGYKTVKYELEKAVKPGRVYEMVLSAQARKIQKQMVLFKVTPANSNATVMYAVNSPNAKEEMLGMLNEYGQLSKNLPLGSYTYRIVSTDYKSSNGLLVLNDTDGTYVEEVKLRPNFSTITFCTEPGVQVFVDGESVGYGTCSINLNVGKYNVECRKEFYKSAFMVVNVEEERNDSIFMKPLTPIIGSLSVITEPSGAEIIIDGDNYGTTPKNVNELLIGRHSLALSLDGYKRVEKTIYIKEGETEEVDVVLDKIPVKGTLRIGSSPEGASVTLNGKLQSLKTPCVIDGLSPGKYEVKVEKSGYKSATSNVDIVGSGVHNLNMALEPAYNSSVSSASGSLPHSSSSKKSSSSDEPGWMDFLHLGITASAGRYNNVESDDGDLEYEIGVDMRLGLLDFDGASWGYGAFRSGLRYYNAGISRIKASLGFDSGSFFYWGLSYDPQLCFCYDKDSDKNVVDFANGFSARLGIATRHHDFNIRLALFDFYLDDDADDDDSSYSVGGVGLSFSYTYFF